MRASSSMPPLHADWDHVWEPPSGLALIALTALTASVHEIASQHSAVDICLVRQNKEDSGNGGKGGVVSELTAYKRSSIRSSQVITQHFRFLLWLHTAQNPRIVPRCEQLSMIG